MSTLDDLVIKHPLPTLRRTAWWVMISIMSFILWAYFAQLEEVSIAPGEVVPEGRVKIIQHLEGGLIEAIHVTEGNLIQEGDALLDLDLAVSGTNLAELQATLDGLLITRTRLTAESEGQESPPAFDPELKARRANVVEAEMRTFEARRSELNNQLTVLMELERQRTLDIDELRARQAATKKRLDLTKENFTMSERLLRSGLVSKMDHIALERELSALEGEAASLRPAIPRARSALNEVRERIEEQRNRFKRAALEELGRVEVAISRQSELLDEAASRDNRTSIRSPTEGVVKNIRHTIGGVVRPGEPIMEIVPARERLVIEAKLNPVDRGYVRPGQAADVKITTYEFTRYGSLEGVVSVISPGSSVDETGLPYFRVVVETDRNYLGEQEGDLPITPGMQAQVDIKTGRRSMLKYLLKPMLTLQAEAFRER